jgi:hypothetical protein
VTDVTDVRKQDVVGLLLEQHRQIRALFGEVATAQGTRKRELFEDLVRPLAVHESAEEQVVHPAARRGIDGGDEVATHEEQEEFQYLRRNVPADKLRKMAGALKAAEAIAPTRPHPTRASPPPRTCWPARRSRCSTGCATPCVTGAGPTTTTEGE